MTKTRSAAVAVAPDGVSAAMHLLPAVPLGQPPSLRHSLRLLDRFGMVQFARGATPDLDYGYCLDDNARAFLAAVITLRLDPQLEGARELGDAALHFMEKCRRPDGRFHNLMASDGSFTDEVGSQDSLGRLVWACGVAACCADEVGWRDRADELLGAALDRADDLSALRPVSYAILGLSASVAPQAASPIAPLIPALNQTTADKAQVVLERLCAWLAAQFGANASEDWQWFEPLLVWANGRPPEALLRGAAALGDRGLASTGLRALKFLASVTHDTDTFVPIGNRGWYERGGKRALYDQQPIEACAMVDAWLAAASLTEPLECESKALEAFSWFLGLNTERLALVEPETGGCHDGLARGEINPNMGAESTLSYVHAHAALAAHFRQRHVVAAKIFAAKKM